jgi:Lrp/AsnC family transcriptional regulator, leucine-responsive regulatory protein
MNKIDLKDKKIIYQLSLDARKNSSKIAKKVGLSPQLVDYKIKRLERIGVINGYYTCIDISKIGYSIFKIYIKLQNLDMEKEKEMLFDLQKNPNITWVALCDGMWDLYLVIWAKNVFQFNDIFNEINNKYSFYISKKSIILNTEVLQFMRKYLAPSKKETDYSVVKWAGEIAKVELDKTDFLILIAISPNARLSYTEIADKLNISRKVVSYRIKKLTEQKIIYGFKPFLNGDLLNFKTYKVLLTIQSLTSEKEKELAAFLNNYPYVIETLHCIGNWEMEIDIESPSINTNHDLIRELRHKFTDVIRDAEMLHIYKSFKYNYLPEGLKEIKEKLSKD